MEWAEERWLEAAEHVSALLIGGARPVTLILYRSDDEAQTATGLPLAEHTALIGLAAMALHLAGTDFNVMFARDRPEIHAATQETRRSG
jgi:hypothetical protein